MLAPPAPGTVVTSELAIRHEGLWVRRGPDWSWGDQDGNSGFGMIIYDKNDDADWITVEWRDDNALNLYRIGNEDKHDLIFSLPPPDAAGTILFGTVAEPTIPADYTPVPVPQMRVSATVVALYSEGVRVSPGPDYDWDEHSGADPDDVGVATYQGEEGFVSVVWPNGTTGVFRGGSDSSYDLRFANPPLVRMPAPKPAVAVSAAASVASPLGVANVASPAAGSPVGAAAAAGLSTETAAAAAATVSAVFEPVVTSTKPIVFEPPCYGLLGASADHLTAAAALASESKKPTLGAVVTPDNYADGRRIVRGPDWKWGDQDGGGEGVLLQLKEDGWARVRWNGGSENSYRVRQASDLRYAAALPPSWSQRALMFRDGLALQLALAG